MKPACEASAVSGDGPESCPSAGRRKSGMLRGLEAYSEVLGLVGGQVTTDPACLIEPIIPRFVPTEREFKKPKRPTVVPSRRRCGRKAGGCRNLWIATTGFRSYRHPPFCPSDATLPPPIFLFPPLMATLHLRPLNIRLACPAPSFPPANNHNPLETARPIFRVNRFRKDAAFLHAEARPSCGASQRNTERSVCGGRASASKNISAIQPRW